ncbi:MAG TPA: hypothetical protein DC049_08610 [Spirochaetia bacterium]|nr:hypothetical protein [Spirochaetia bacterium]
MALYDTESSFRQFTKDGNLLYGRDKDGYTSAVGLSQITKGTALRNDLKLDYSKLQTDWKYNLEGGVKFYSKMYHQQDTWYKSDRTISVEAYSRYHSGYSTDGSRRGDYTDVYLNRYNKY